jgi:hypothetical protein
MSKDILIALSEQAISRMNPYELAERAVGLRSAMYNGLSIEPLELENGATLYTVTSGLAATSEMEQETVVEGEDLIRRRFVQSPLTAFADVVELQPPTKDTDGDAKLYRIEKPVTAISAEARALFRVAATELMATRDPTYGRSSITFVGTSNTYYDVEPEVKHPDETYMSQGGVRLLADQRARIQLETVGKNELDDRHLGGQLGVLATISGLARFVLKERHFARITDTGVLYGPSAEKIVEVNVPPDTPQLQSGAFHRIPNGATVGPNEKGDLVPQGESIGGNYEHVKLNPNISPATMLKLIPPDTIDWTDGRAAFIKALSDRIARMMPLDVEGSYAQTLRAAREEIKKALLANLTSTVGNIGCLAVAARLAELPTSIDNTTRVDAAFFSS